MNIETPNPGGLSLLAQGPISAVYAGRMPGTGAEFAVKVFPGGFDRETSAWLDRERKALAALRSTRSILQADEVIEYADGRVGIRRELCQGSLAGLLDSGARLTVRDTLVIGTAITSALAAAHRADVLHGGVTPHNVLYRASGEFVLADFGMALRRRFPRDPMYSVEYAAPETLRDDTLSPASDLYGLGAVLYAALTGSPPFPYRTGQQPGERILQVLREPVIPLGDPQIPDELSDAISRLLAKEPVDRPQDATALVGLFEKLLREGGSVPAMPQQTASEEDGEQEDVDVEFDDFAELGTAAPAPVPIQPVPMAMPVVPPATGGRTLVRTFGGPAPTSRRFPWRAAVLAGGGALAAGLAVVPMVTGPEQVAGQAVPVAAAIPPPQPTSSAPAPNVRLELAPPNDLSTHVQLTWRADGELDFAVVIAGERLETRTLAAHRQRTMDVPVDPARRYCFQIRATDGSHVYTTEPAAIRGATCNP